MPRSLNILGDSFQQANGILSITQKLNFFENMFQKLNNFSLMIRRDKCRYFPDCRTKLFSEIESKRIRQTRINRIACRAQTWVHSWVLLIYIGVDSFPHSTPNKLFRSTHKKGVVQERAPVIE